MADQFEDLRRRVEQLYVDLHRLVERDPDQEVLDDVLEMVDGLVELARAALPNDPVMRQVKSLYTARATVDRELRAAEVMLVIGQVRAAIPGPKTEIVTPRRRSGPAVEI